MSACPRCGRPHDTEAVSRTASAGKVTVRLEHLPVRRCPAPGGGGGVAGEDRAALEAAVDEQLARAEPRWLRRRGACTRCGAALSMPVRRTRRSVTAPLRVGGPVIATFDLPRTRCPECALDQVPARAVGDLQAAVGAALSG